MNMENVEKIMVRNVVTCSSTNNFSQIQQLMTDNGIGRVVVVDEMNNYYWIELLSRFVFFLLAFWQDNFRVNFRCVNIKKDFLFCILDKMSISMIKCHYFFTGLDVNDVSPFTRDDVERLFVIILDFSFNTIVRPREESLFSNINLTKI